MKTFILAFAFVSIASADCVFEPLHKNPNGTTGGVICIPNSGATGATGAQGITGSTGSTGSTGAQGATGSGASGTPVVKTASYQLLSSDNLVGVMFKGTSAMTATLPASMPGVGFYVPIFNCTNAALTITIPATFNAYDQGSTTTTPATLPAPAVLGGCTYLTISQLEAGSTYMIARGPGGGGSSTSYGTIELSTATGEFSGNVVPGAWNLGGANPDNTNNGGGFAQSNSGSPFNYTFPIRLPYDIDLTKPVLWQVAAVNKNGVSGNLRFTLAVGCWQTGANGGGSGGPNIVFGTPASSGTIASVWTQVNQSVLGGSVDYGTTPACHAGDMALYQLGRDNSVSGNLADVVLVVNVVLRYARM